MGWNLPEKTVVEFLPCIGGFVGSDILAGIVATGLHESRELVALMDLGTNGEVVVGNHERLLCASTAAGPAFEGARISMGMRAATGAISEVRAQNGTVACRVIGGGAPRGLCGSGLVDAVAAGLELGWIRPDGRMTSDRGMPLAGTVTLSAADVRELQLAKGAIATGLRMLAARFGASLDDIHQLHLAGAFGNYINRASAQRIGLLRVPLIASFPPATRRCWGRNGRCSKTRPAGTPSRAASNTWRSMRARNFKTPTRRKCDSGLSRCLNHPASSVTGAMLSGYFPAKVRPDRAVRF